MAQRNARTKLGRRFGSTNLSESEPTFQTWFERVFLETRHPSLAAGRSGTALVEMDYLTRAADLLSKGRFPEAADLVTSRLRYLTTGVETGQWDMARQFLTYAPRNLGFTPIAMQDAALAEVEREGKRRKRQDKRGSAVG